MGQKLPLKLAKLEILGVLVNIISLENAVSLVREWVKSNKQYQIVTPNPEQIVLAQENEEFKRVLNAADLAIPDGIGIVIAMRLLNIKNKILKIKNTNKKLKIQSTDNWRSKFFKKIPFLLGKPSSVKVERVSGTDLMLALCKKAAKKGWRVMLVGGKGKAAALAAEKIKNLKCKPSSRAQVEGMQNCNSKFKIDFYGGADDIRKETEAERRDLIERINKFRPDFLFVAYGVPCQELWIARNLPKLKVGVAMGVGGAFDFISGRIPRAPGWIRDCGFEWLYRLAREPWRFSRQLKLLKFAWLVLKSG